MDAKAGEAVRIHGVSAGEDGDARPVHESHNLLRFVEFSLCQLDHCGSSRGRKMTVIASVPFCPHFFAQILQSWVIRIQGIVDLALKQGERGSLPGSILRELRKQRLGSGFVERFNHTKVESNDALPGGD